MTVSGRQSVVVELAADVQLAAGLSRAQHVAELRRAANDAKRQFLGRLDDLRRIDPDIEVLSQDSIFPVLVVTATPDAIEALASIPGVKHVSASPEVSLQSR